ncbi:hypothetical protein [Pseudomonas putida]|jgi:hypothetical protein|uniref:hypothetical protein n=1 Tax=Pseudomonas putida TaxID=303 RepID=UPI002363FDA2|nr:hypothetical protein [Pseudomonas putida]MDD2098831.1 hypothetical protein [Pseudomonas putida]
MHHVFALNLIAETTDLPVTSDYVDLPKQRRTSIVDGFRVDKNTGEIYGQFVASPLQANIEQYRCGIPRPPTNPSQYLHLVDVRKNDDVVYVDFGGPTPAKPTTVINVLGSKPKRGPKPNVCLNQFAAITKVAIAENAHWVEDAVMAGMYIAVESSNGKLNIRPGYVRKVLTMSVISTEAISRNSAFRNHDFEPVSERYARYLAAAGRVALRNVERHLDAHPAVLQRLEAKVLESTVWGEEFDLDETDYVEGPYGASA